MSNNVEGQQNQEIPVNSQDSIKPTPQNNNKREGTVRDLAVFFLFVLFISISAIFISQQLILWKLQVDIRPVISYSWLTWSESNNKMAFLQTETRNENDVSSLWVLDGYSKVPQKISNSIESGSEILGWFAEDTTIMLQVPSKDNANDGNQERVNPNADKETSKAYVNSHNSDSNAISFSQNKDQKDSSLKDTSYETQEPKESKISLLEVSQDGKTVRKYSFSATDIKLVGSSDQEVFFSRPYLDEDTKISGAELLSWSPETQELNTLTKIPNHENEKLSIKKVEASPDNKQLAIVIIAEPAIADYVTKTAGITARESALGLWILSRESSSLTWTTFSAPHAEEFSIDWSKDATWLTGAATTKDLSQIFLLVDNSELESASLRSPVNCGPMEPVVQTLNREVFLVNNRSIIRYDFEKQAASAVFEAEKYNLLPKEISLSHCSNSAALIARETGEDAIYTFRLNNLLPTPLEMPETVVKTGWLYTLASGLDCSVSYWLKATGLNDNSFVSSQLRPDFRNNEADV